MRPSHLLRVLPFLALCFTAAHCWKAFEPDLFDLVEDVGKNFYEVFEITKDSDDREIKKAYRKLSLLWHPDKNSDPEAEKTFRQIVGIYEVLKDKEKRERYDEILEFGLPDWRQPVYYFRKARKLNFTELVIGFAVIISITHYFVMWAQYFETKLTVEDRLNDIRKRMEKKQKKKKNNIDMEEVDENLKKCYESIPSPSLKQTLPIRFSLWAFYFALGLPALIQSTFRQAGKKPMQVEEPTESDEEEAQENMRLLKKKEAQELSKSLNPTKIEKSNIKAPVLTYELGSNANDSNNNNKSADLAKKPKEWSDKEKADLIKAIVKFPPGTSDRWIKIGEFVGRQASECLNVEKQMKSNITSSSFSNLNASTWKEGSADEENSSSGNEKTIASPELASEAWSQEQQLQLEKALKEFNKDVPNRWDKIASNVTNKTKEDCINRYKVLCSAVKKK